MELKELRIGNYIQLRGVKNVIHPDIANWSSEKCNIYHLEDINNKNKDWEYKPIPLTEDWLLKFWFKIDENKNYWIPLDEFATYLQLTETDMFYPMIRQTGELSYEKEQYVSLNGIKYVHQLQNLYFALTGQELEIKTI